MNQKFRCCFCQLEIQLKDKDVRELGATLNKNRQHGRHRRQRYFGHKACLQQTVFRKTMIEELELMVSPRKIKRYQKNHPFLDAREEIISSWVDYYYPELFDSGVMNHEFSKEELRSVKKFVGKLNKLYCENKATWQDVTNWGKSLLKLLKLKKIKSGTV